MSLEAAAKVARRAGITPHILGDRIEGEARHLGTALAGIARHVADHGQPFDAPCVLLSGGETTVDCPPTRGAADATANSCWRWASPCKTILEFLQLPEIPTASTAPERSPARSGRPTAPSAREAFGLRPRDSLDGNDAHTFFERLGDGVVTGPTMTNVNDFRAILILDQSATNENSRLRNSLRSG